MIFNFFCLIFQELRSFLGVRLAFMPTLFNHFHIQVGLFLKKNVIFSKWKRYFFSKFWPKNFSLRFLEEIDKVFLLDAEMRTIWSKDPSILFLKRNLYHWQRPDDLSLKKVFHLSVLREVMVWSLAVWVLGLANWWQSSSDLMFRRVFFCYPFLFSAIALTLYMLIEAIFTFQVSEIFEVKKKNRTIVIFFEILSFFLFL